MTHALEFPALVTNGKLPRDVSERIAAVIRRMEGKRLVVSIKEQKRYSSNQQRKYYFGVIVEEFQCMFYDAGTVIDKLDMHHWMMEHIGRWFREVITPDGEITRIRRSYTDLSTQETEVHHTLCRQWAAERGRDIAEPNESNQPTRGDEYEKRYDAKTA